MLDNRFVFIISVIVVGVLLVYVSTMKDVNAQSVSQQMFSITPVSGTYSDPQTGVVITFPDGWKGSRMFLGNQTIITLFENSTTGIRGPAILFEIADKSIYQKQFGSLDLNDSKTFRQILGEGDSRLKECDVVSLTPITVNGMNGEAMTEQCSGTQPSKFKVIGFVTNTKFAYLAFGGPSTEFDKYERDFGNVLNSLKIANPAEIQTIRTINSTASYITKVLSGGAQSETAISGKYSDTQNGIEITFPDGWSGQNLVSRNVTLITVNKNTTEFFPPTITLEIVDKSIFQKMTGLLMNLAKDPLIVNASKSAGKGCDYTNATITIHGMGGEEMTVHCTGFPIKTEMIMFASNRNIISLGYQAQQTEFEKYNADFNNTLTTLKISNAVNPFNIEDLLPPTASLDTPTSMSTTSMNHQSLSPPLKQIRSGIVPDSVQCNQGFTLVYKAENDSPACVKALDAAHLVQIGWAK